MRLLGLLLAAALVVAGAAARPTVHTVRCLAAAGACGGRQGCVAERWRRQGGIKGRRL